MTFSVEAALDAYVLSRASTREPDSKWHPSAIFGCERKAIYTFRGEQPSDPTGPQQQRTFFIGSRWHEIVQAAVSDHGGADEVYTEVAVDHPDLEIVGHADQLVRFGDEWEAQEYKSISQRGFEFSLKKGDLPKADHVQQAMTYMYVLRTRGAVVPRANDPGGWHTHPPSDEPVSNSEGGCSCGRYSHATIPPLGDSLKAVRFTYIAKGDLSVREFVVPWDPEFQVEIEKRIANLNTYRADPASLPARLPMEKGKKNWMCGGNWGMCPFYTRCWQQDPDEVAPGSDY